MDQEENKFFQHHPPLNTREPEACKLPKLVNRNAFTYAMPATETRFFRNTSDIIANNYSPYAKDLSSRVIWNKSKSDVTRSLKDNISSRPEEKGLVFLSTLTEKPRMTSQPQDRIPTSNTYKKTRIFTTNNLFKRNSDNSLAFASDNSSKVERLFSLILNSESKLTSALNQSNLYIIQRDILRANSMPNYYKKLNRINKKTSDMKQETTSNKNLLTKSQFDFDKQQTDVADVQVNKVEFPPWFTSTKGLSRPNSPIPSNSDRYQFLIQNCLEDDKRKHTVERTDTQVLTRIINMSRVDLEIYKRYPNLVLEYFSEVDKDLNWSNNKAIVDYILRDEGEQNRLGVQLKKKSPVTAGREAFPWHVSTVEAHHYLRCNLFRIKSSLKEINSNFFTRYANLRLIDLDQLMKVMPVTSRDLKILVKMQLEKKRQWLIETWLSECALSVETYQEEIETSAAGTQRKKILDMYFEAAAMAVAMLCRYMVEETLKDLKDFFSVYNNGNEYKEPYNYFSGLALPYRVVPLRFYLEADQVLEEAIVQPSLTEVKKDLDDIVDLILECVEGLPRLEMLLFKNSEEFKRLRYKNLVMRSEEQVLECKKILNQVVEANSYGFVYKNIYKAYSYMISSRCQQETNRLLAKKLDQSILLKYIKQTERLHDTRKQVCLLPTELPMNLFTLDCSHINTWLCHQTHKFTDLLANQCYIDNHILNTSIIEKFNQIYIKLMTPPNNADECVNLIKYLDYSRLEECFQLRDQAIISMARIMFLVGHVSYTTEDIRLNSLALTWYEKIQPIYLSTDVYLLNSKETWIKKLRFKTIDTKSRLQDYSVKLNEFKSRDRFSEAHDCCTELQAMSREIQEITSLIRNVKHEEEIFVFETTTDFSLLEEVCDLKDLFDKLWMTSSKCIDFEEKWMNSPIYRMDPEMFESELHGMYAVCYQLMKVFKTPDFMGPLRVTFKLKAKIEALKTYTRIVQILTNPGLRPRHFKTMSNVLGGQDITPTHQTCLSHISDTIKELIETNSDKLMAIVNVANKEHSLENTYKKMKNEWAEMRLEFVNYKDRTDVSVLAGYAEIQTLCEDHLTKTKTIMYSSMFAEFRQEVERWYKKLSDMKTILSTWIQVQALWIYLEPVFSSENICKQIPEETEQFRLLDKIWHGLSAVAVLDTLATKVFGIDSVLEKLTEALQIGETVLKALNQNLEQKRMYFPRFFFLSNDELIDIFNASSDIRRVEPHLFKCFEGIRRLDYTPSNYVIGIVSSEGEVVKFYKEVNPFREKGAVEKWLSEVERVMKVSLQAEAVKAMADLKVMSRFEWINSFPAQIVLATSEIVATAELSNAIVTKNGFSYFINKSNRCLDELVHLLRDSLSKLARIAIEALIITDVHARDLALELSSNNITQQDDYTWVSQMRYYLEEERIIVKMIAVSIKYDYEYLGNNGRLVITPLTERCYRTLLGAIQLNLGGAPEGPAGTGKTETTKNLAKVVAKKCMVFNCSDALDYKAMGKFFKGLVQSGVWVCLDEFNRIELQVLSVIAQQIQTIQRAISERKQTFFFEDTKLRLDSSCAIFITMNQGYAGRTELPDNLKVLFRPVAMMVPDYALISQISLYSKGFKQAELLARKIVTTYKLCSEQLSVQYHYDYGMRAVKSVLDLAGLLKLKHPKEKEEHIVLRAIKDTNLPKFLAEDVRLFNDILLDLFPGVNLTPLDYDMFTKALRNTMAQMKLEYTEALAEKVMQVYEMVAVRRGIMMIGNSMVGKTSAWRVLVGTLNEVSELEVGSEGEAKVDWEVVNPKGLSLTQLYGRFDSESHEWTDGVLSNIFRKHATSDDYERKWIILDGPVDSLWIDNLNTVLDDNKKLCLINGEIIPMASKQTLIFETLDLRMASPATVSRCGMCFFSPHTLQVSTIARTWLQHNLPKSIGASDTQTINLLIDWLLQPCLDFVQQPDCHSFIPAQPIHLVYSFFRLYECLIRYETLALIDENEKRDEQAYASVVRKGKERISEMLVAYFFASVVWSIGACLHQASREKFSNFFTKLIRNELPSHPKPKNLTFSRSALVPNILTVYDFMYVQNSPGNPFWAGWPALCGDSQKMPDDLYASGEFQVNTGETYRQSFFMDRLLVTGRPVLLVGPSGTGKSLFMREYLRTGLAGDWFVKKMNFSVSSSQVWVQEKIVDKMVRRRDNTYGAGYNKKTILYVDDLNTPDPEVYGSQTAIETLRHLLDHRLVYDRSRNNQLEIEDLLLVGTMTPERGGHLNTSSRFIRHFNILSIESFNNDLMRTIFQPIINTHFAKAGLAEHYDPGAFMLIDASVKIYNHVVSTFLPTPAKLHYLFDFRDFTRLIQGVLLFTSAGLSRRATKETNFYTIIRLWIHESCRVFADRFNDPFDTEQFHLRIREIVESEFKVLFENLFRKNPDDESQQLVQRTKEAKKLPFSKTIQNLYFGITLNLSKKNYVEIRNLEQLKTTIESFVLDYNKVSKTPMDLVVFDFLISHLSRLSRILRLPKANALLIGIDGTGRASTTKLAAFLADFQFVQLEIPRTFSHVNWRNHLKHLLQTTGLKKVNTAFLFTDNQVRSDSFLQDLAHLLTTGDIPDLFDSEETSHITQQIEKQLKEVNPLLDLDKHDLYNKFIEQSQRHLRIILKFSPAGDNLKKQLRKFPCLVRSCSVDFYPEWTSEGLLLVANQFLAEVEIDEKFRSNVIDMCPIFHQEAIKLSERFMDEVQRRNYTTPTTYLEFIRTFKRLLDKKRSEILATKDRYSTGIEKLKFAESQIKVLEKEASELQTKTVAASSQLQELIDQSRQEADIVEAAREVVEKDKEKCAEVAREAQQMKDEVEAELAKVLPKMEEATEALNTLTPKDMTSLKQMIKPSEGVRLVMEAVCVMKGVKPDKMLVKTEIGDTRTVNNYWTAARRMLKDLHFLQSLKDYDKDNIPPEIINKIRSEYISCPEFRPDLIRNISSACEGICKWVIAISVYDETFKLVAPKQAVFEAAQAKLENEMAVLKAKETELALVEAKLEEVLKQLWAKQMENDTLQEKIDKTRVRLERAEKIKSGLSDEQTRWTNKVDRLTHEFSGVVGNVLLSAAVISYLGAFTFAYRQDTVKMWVKMCRDRFIPCSKSFSLIKSIGDPVVIRDWHSTGLPTDSFSTESALIAFCAERWPLMLDPQNQANSWIKRLEKPNNLTITTELSDTFIKDIENCLIFGHPLLIEDFQEQLNPLLEPILLNRITRQGTQDYINFNDNQIEFNNSFKLYITTRLKNPSYLPDAGAKVKLVNFVITPPGLQDQLLGIVSKKEIPEAEGCYEEAVIESISNSKRLKIMEDQILAEFAKSKGNFLDDETAVEVLTSCKRATDEINEKQALLDKTEQEMLRLRLAYTSTALNATCLFFTLNDLTSIDHMYQFSLDWFINLYELSIKAAEGSDVQSKRIRSINDHFNLSVYSRVCRSIFEKHKLLFSFLLCVNLIRGDGQLDDLEWMFFLTGAGLSLSPRVKQMPERVHTWMSEKTWTALVNYQSLCQKNHPSLKISFIEDIESRPDKWHQFTENPDTYSIPNHKKLTRFQRLCLVKILRPDKLFNGVQNFVKDQLGPRFVEPPVFNLEASFIDSNSSTPLIFILSQGEDPLKHFDRLARDYNMNHKIYSVSLGQGQAPIALKAIEEGIANKTWVLLQNCHLAVFFFSELEKICNDLMLRRGDLPAEFRLWLTTYSTESFPVSVLENSVKITNEPPYSLRSSLLLSYMTEPISDNKFFEVLKSEKSTSVKKTNGWKKLLFGLCMFHAIVQERRKYGPLGWNNLYEFNDSDLKISIHQLKLFFETYDTTPYSALTNLIGECNYGGRITDKMDRRLINAILYKFYSPQIDSDQSFTFFPDAPTYLIPAYSVYNDYLDYITKLPPLAQPEAIGLHVNSMIQRNHHESQSLIDNILLTLPRKATNNFETSQSLVVNICLEITQKLNKFDLNNAKAIYPIQFSNSLNGVLIQELTCFNQLIQTIKTSISEIQRSLSGRSIISRELEYVFNSILMGKIPQLWLENSYPSLKPLGSYIADLSNRLEFFNKWLTDGAPNVFWLSSFFSTQAFLTGIVQSYARSRQVPIDLLELDFNLTNKDPEDFTEVNSEGVFIYGLFMIGARWCRISSMIQESLPGVIFDRLPVIRIKPIEKVVYVERDGIYRCPVYKTSIRQGSISSTGVSTNYVLMINVPTDRGESHWIIRSVAILCQLDD